MIHRNLRYIAGWEWHGLQLKHIPVSSARRRQINSKAFSASLQHTDEQYITEKQELIQSYPEVTAWINDSYERFTNNILIQKYDKWGSVVQGTIVLQLSEDEEDIAPLHFWLSSHRLITMQRDARIPLRLQQLTMMEEYENCQHAPEAFFLMLTILLESLHIGLDRFEERLGALEKDMKEQNRKDLLDLIIERRYELLHYSHLYLPIRELEGLAKEAFLEQLTESEGYQRIQYRFQRIDSSLRHYAGEIDTLISVDDALSNFRGNEIIRTLTIFTAICLPASIIGAIWGTNFIKVPFKNEPFGFLYMLGAILIITATIYYLFWRKGWTGDILTKRRHSQQPEKLKEVILERQPRSSSPLDIKDKVLPSRKLRARQKKNTVVTYFYPPNISESNEDMDQPLPSRKRR